MTLSLYLREIRKYKTLSSAEEGELARRIREGDRHALNKLVCSNLKFVISVCSNFTNRGLTLSDLINEGNLGLIRAARRFDEKRQFRFISYAVWWVRQSILQALADQSRLVKLPPNRIGTLQRINKTHMRLEQTLGRAPTLEELAGESQVDVPELLESERYNLQPLSLDATRASGEEGSLSDILKDENGESPEEALTAAEIREAIVTALHSLNPKEESVLRLYFGIDAITTLSLVEIGIRMGITRERVRQIKETALRKLRQAPRAIPLQASTIGG